MAGCSCESDEPSPRERLVALARGHSDEVVARQRRVVPPRVGCKEKVVYLNSHRRLRLAWCKCRKVADVVTFVAHVRCHRRALGVRSLQQKKHKVSLKKLVSSNNCRLVYFGDSFARATDMTAGGVSNSYKVYYGRIPSYASIFKLDVIVLPCGNQCWFEWSCGAVLEEALNYYREAPWAYCRVPASTSSGRTAAQRTNRA